MTDIQLNDEQATAILTEGLSRGLYESLNGTLPPDSTQRLKDATDLANAAKAAFNNGNRSDNVQTILFIAQVDQKPINNELNGANVPTKSVDEAPDEIAIEGFDITQVSDGVLEGLIIGLDKFPNNDKVENERRAYLAEKERRANEKAGKSQDDSSGTTPQATSEKAGEAAPEGSGSETEMGSQESPEDQGTKRATAIGSSDDGTADSAQGEDAGAFARAQTPETSPEEKQAKAKPVEEDGNRVVLEEQLTLPIVKAHGVDISKLDSLLIDQIEFMVENPDGPPLEGKEKKMAISEQEVESTAITNKEVKAVSGILADESISPERVVSKKDLGLEGVDSSSTDNLDRENLEAQVTGPCLKAYGRGRKEIPSIGVNELRFMVEHPDGKVDPSDLDAARALDDLGKPYTTSDGSDDPIRASIEEKMVITKEVPGPEKVDHFLPEQLADPIKLSEEKDRTIGKAAKEAVIKGPPTEEVNNKWNTKSVVGGEQQQSAEEIIAREGFPIPPAYSDERAPEFPVDMSKCTRDELYSFHAEFHAYEIRINYILIEYEDRLNDWVHKRSYREAVVAKSVPFMGEDGKRNTNEYRDVQTKGDEEVLELSYKEQESRKIVNDLRILQKNYHLSCERLSRQMSKYENEMRDAPR